LPDDDRLEVLARDRIFVQLADEASLREHFEGRRIRTLRLLMAAWRYTER
jgi:hypothetical protein